MKKLTLPTLVLFILCCSRLMAQGDKVDSSEMKTLRIDPSTARGANAAQVFSEINFIPLETTKESLFGAIDQLKLTDDRFVIWDFDTKAILIFDKQGKFKGKINNAKIDKDPENNNARDFYGFTIKRENGHELIEVASRTMLYSFDLTGNLIQKIKNESPSNFLQFSDGTKVEQSYLEKKDNDSTYFEISLQRNKKNFAAYFSYKADRYKTDQFLSPGGEPITDYGVKDELFFVRPYDYNIYKITPKKMYLAYNIIFPAVNSLPSDFMQNQAYKGKRIEYFEKSPKIYYAIGSTYKIGNNLYFKAVNFSWGNDEKRGFIYNLKSNALTSVTDIEPDTLSQFLPITDAGVGNDFVSRGFLLYDKQYLYTTYSALALFRFKELNDSKNRKYNPTITEFFKTQNKKSNPILIQIKPKDN